MNCKLLAHYDIFSYFPGSNGGNQEKRMLVKMLLDRDSKKLSFPPHPYTHLDRR